MIRICLIIAIVAGLGVAVVNFVKVKEVITETRTSLITTSNTLETTKVTLRKTETDLKKTSAELVTTKSTLKTTEDERNTAQANAEASKKAAEKLTSDLATRTSERDSARADLAGWIALGIPVDQVKGVINDLKEAQKEIAVDKVDLKLLATKNRSLTSKLDSILGHDPRVALPETLRGNIVAVDPKWDFVVLDVGSNQGAITNGEMLISRNGKLVAKVRISAVQHDRCIANVVAGWKLGDIVEGDSAIPAFTGS